MPHVPTLTEIRLTNIIACLTPAVTILNKLSDGFGTPFVQAIANTTLALIVAVRDVKRNKNECAQLMERIYSLVYAIISIHIKSETAGTLPPATLHHIAKFTETLHKIYTFVQTQQDGNTIKHFFRRGEMKTLLNDCHTGLKAALEGLEIEASSSISDNITEMQSNMDRMHNELLEMISNLSDGTTSDRTSSIYSSTTCPENSSKSISMLPAEPKIFHGRKSELEDIVSSLSKESARIAILGAGGIGKTSLAKVALHHPYVTGKYQHRFFIGCDSATTSIDLAAIIGSHLELKPEKDLTKRVIHYFSSKGPCLLILDNLETPWEPSDSRRGTEEFLALLADIEHLALIITMQGAERPAKVRWTKPFLPPLGTLPNEAARQTFVDIADDFHDSNDINTLLSLTDNMPLAVNLLAHLVDCEGCPNVLHRWNTEKTSLLSSGWDRKSNLDASVALSLSSPRLAAVSGVKDLLSLLSLLPDGLSDVELLQSNIQIDEVLTCKTALLHTSLAYRDDNGRLKVLAPIREHMRNVHPPSPHFVQALRKYFHDLLDLYSQYQGRLSGLTVVHRVIQNRGNLHSILLLGLDPANPEVKDTILFAISLNRFRRLAGYGSTSLMDHIPAVMNQLNSHKLEAHFLTEIFQSWKDGKDFDIDNYLVQAREHFDHLQDPTLEARFYVIVAGYYLDHHIDIPASMKFSDMALSLSTSSGDLYGQCTALVLISWINWRMSDYPKALQKARETQRVAKLATNLYQESRAFTVEAMALYSLGHYNQTLVVCHAGRRLLDMCGLSGGPADRDLMSTAAEVHLLKSEYAEARSIQMTIAHETSPEQNVYNHAYALFNIAQIDVIIGASEHDVHQNLNIARRIFTTMKSQIALTECDQILADLYLREGRFVDAKKLFVQCVSSSWGKKNDIVFYCLDRLGNSDRWNPDNRDGTLSWTMVFLAFGFVTKGKLALHKAICYLGDIFNVHGDLATAESLYTVALQGFTQMDIHSGRAECMLRLGDISSRYADSTKAVELWRDARPLFERFRTLNVNAGSIQAVLAMVSGQQKPIGVKKYPHPRLTWNGETGDAISNGVVAPRRTPTAI
ncbi:hypothetical protein C8R44DRAFT_951063 [Mycena epipterygia]|nr:hypothetical protein C8R44DRAFT_951063 [Mycena epipterygia]